MRDGSPLVDETAVALVTGGGLPVSFAADQLDTDIDTWIEITEIDSSFAMSIEVTDGDVLDGVGPLLDMRGEKRAYQVWGSTVYVALGVLLGAAMVLGSASLASATSGY